MTRVTVAEVVYWKLGWSRVRRFKAVERRFTACVITKVSGMAPLASGAYFWRFVPVTAVASFPCIVISF